MTPKRTHDLSFKKAILLLIGVIIAATASGQILVEKGVKGTPTDYTQQTVLVGDSTKVTQNFNKPPYNIAVFQANPTDTASYVMITQFFKKYRPAPPVDPGVVIDIGAYAAQQGVSITNGVIGSFDKTDWIRYDFNLIKPRTKILYEYAMSDATGGGIQFRTGSATGPIFAEVLLPVTGGWSTFHTIEITINPPYGTNSITSIYLTCNNSPRTTGSGGNLKSLVFK